MSEVKKLITKWKEECQELDELVKNPKSGLCKINLARLKRELQPRITQLEQSFKKDVAELNKRIDKDISLCVFKEKQFHELGQLDESECWKAMKTGFDAAKQLISEVLGEQIKKPKVTNNEA